MNTDKYEFRAVDPYSSFSRSKLINIVDPRYDYGVTFARIRGAMLTLFGDPLYTTEFDDQAYEYHIEASDGQGRMWTLSVYQGATGPAIGGDQKVEGILEVAEVLAELIINTPPADFQATCYYEDENVTLIYECSNGECTVKSVKGNQLEQS